MRLIRSLIFLGPVERRRETEIKTWPIIPLFTTVALPAQVRQLFKADVSACVAHARSFIATGTEQAKLDQLFRLIIPCVVRLENELAVVAQRIGKRILF